MFKMITWPQYLGAVAVLLVLYYAYVALVYYRAELTGLVSGKGKAAAGDQDSPAPTTLLNRGPLIPTAAVVLPVAPPADQPTEKAAPDAEAAPTELEEVAVDEVSVEAPDETEEQAQQEPDEEAEKEGSKNTGNDFNEIDNSNVENSVNFTAPESDEIDPVTQDGAEETVEEFEEDFTVGVAQLSSYFERAADGELTQEQLVQEVPALENTDVLVAFFKNSTKSAQQLTATIFSDVTEPALN